MIGDREGWRKRAYRKVLMTMKICSMEGRETNARRNGAQESLFPGSRAWALVLSGMLACGAFAPCAFGSQPVDGSGEVQVGESLPSERFNVVKNQVVYVKANQIGEQEGVYVVNSFEAACDTRVVDQGRYENVTNLTDMQILENAAGTISFDVADTKAFLYQGDLDASTQTPWTIHVTYALDGKPVSAEDLAGASGRLEMTLSIDVNSACDGNYADNYLLQVSVALSNDNARALEAEDATIAQSGGKTQLTYMVLPGKSAEYTVVADVSDFEFEGWQMVGVPLSLALDVDDSQFDSATEDLNELVEAIEEVDDGALSIAEGSDSVQEGLSALNDASAPLRNGTSSFAGALDSFAGATATLASAVESQLAVGVSALAAGSSAYGEGLAEQEQAMWQAAQASQSDIAAAQSACESNAENLVGAYGSVHAQVFQGNMAMYMSLGIDASQAAALAYADATSAAQSAAAEQRGELASSMQNLAQAAGAAGGYAGAANALSQAAASYADLDAGIQRLADSASVLQEGLSVLNGAVDQLEGGFSTLQSGVLSYTDGVRTLATSYGEMNSGAHELADGTGKLRNETQGLDQKMIESVRDKLQEYLNPEFEVRDFVNNASEGVDAVQFVYMTGSIKPQE